MVLDPQNNSNPPLEMSTAYNIYRTDRLLRVSLAKILEFIDGNITPEQYFILLRLIHKDGVPLSSLADPYLHDYSNITRLVDQLEKKYLVERRSNPNDRRSLLVFLTSEGRSIVEKFIPYREAEFNRIHQGLGEKNIEGLVKSLRQIQENLLNIPINKSSS